MKEKINTNLCCLDIRSLFETMPEVTRCPVCASGALKKRSCKPTVQGEFFIKKAIIPVVTTFRYVCPACGWWAVRELLRECEGSGVAESDKMVTFRPHKALPSLIAEVNNDLRCKSSNDNVPWGDVFLNEKYWRGDEDVTEEQAKWLFGDDEFRVNCKKN